MVIYTSKQIRVSCAIIERGGLVLAARRSSAMSMPLKWEFPGGKLHDGETPEECLLRELDEELGTSVDIIRALPAHTYAYPSFTVTLYPFVCKVAGGEITPREHAEVAWLRPGELRSLDWAEADLPIIEAYLAGL